VRRCRYPPCEAGQNRLTIASVRGERRADLAMVPLAVQQRAGDIVEPRALTGTVERFRRLYRVAFRLDAVSRAAVRSRGRSSSSRAPICSLVTSAGEKAPIAFGSCAWAPWRGDMVVTRSPQMCLTADRIAACHRQGRNARPGSAARRRREPLPTERPVRVTPRTGFTSLSRPRDRTSGARAPGPGATSRPARPRSPSDRAAAVPCRASA
jgi:hypothetical protein